MMIRVPRMGVNIEVQECHGIRNHADKNDTPQSPPHLADTAVETVPPMITALITSNSQPRPKLKERQNWPDIIKPEITANTGW
jgi:hypothetical protein